MYLHYKFANRCEFPEDSVGKLIMCMRDYDHFYLYGLMKKGELKGFSFERAKEYLEQLATTGVKSRTMDAIVGRRSIPHLGRIIARTWALFKEDILFMYGDDKFDAIHPDAVEKCLKGTKIKKIQYKNIGYTRGGLRLWLEHQLPTASLTDAILGIVR